MSVPETHPEVLRIHMQLVTMQFTQLSKGALEVVQMLQTITEGVKHFLAMALHLRVAKHSRRRGQVPKGVKEPLSPGVDHQQPEGWTQHREKGESVSVRNPGDCDISTCPASTHSPYAWIPTCPGPHHQFLPRSPCPTGQ